MARSLTRSAPAPFCPLFQQPLLGSSVAGAFSNQMAALWIIVFATIGLAVRVVTYSRAWSPADSEPANETSLLDTCARTFTLVLLSLIGLLALGVMYGNVLGSANAHP